MSAIHSNLGMLRPVPSFRLEGSQSQMSGHSEDFNDNHQRKLDVAGGLNKCDEDSPKEGASQESKEEKVSKRDDIARTGAHSERCNPCVRREIILYVQLEAGMLDMQRGL